VWKIAISASLYYVSLVLTRNMNYKKKGENVISYPLNLVGLAGSIFPIMVHRGR
jgi:hypothetical protein